MHARSPRAIFSTYPAFTSVTVLAETGGLHAAIQALDFLPFNPMAVPCTRAGSALSPARSLSAH